jgi:hypothetical protein
MFRRGKCLCMLDELVFVLLVYLIKETVLKWEIYIVELVIL